MSGLKPNESWEQYRRRMLRETERFIEWGLAHPEEIIEIPAKPDGQGGFPAGVGEWFWNTVLSSRPTQAMQRWRHFLRNRPKGLWRRVGNRLNWRS
jgi:hypothetical protein